MITIEKNQLTKYYYKKQAYFQAKEIFNLISLKINFSEELKDIIEEYFVNNLFLKDENKETDIIYIFTDYDKFVENSNIQGLYVNLEADSIDDQKYYKTIFKYNFLKEEYDILEKEIINNKKILKTIEANDLYSQKKYVTLLANNDLITLLSDFERQNTIVEAFEKASPENMIFFNGKKFNYHYKGSKLELLQLRNKCGDIYNNFLKEKTKQGK